MSHELLTNDDKPIVQAITAAIAIQDIPTVQEYLTRYQHLKCKYTTSHDRLGLLNRLMDQAGATGNLKLFELFVEHGGDINATGYMREENENEKEGMIQRMFLDGDRCVTVVRWLLQNGAIINHEEHGQLVSNSLLNASISGALEGIKLLVEYGAALNGVSPNGQTALDFAAMYGHKAVADYLISKGACEGWKLRGAAPPKAFIAPATLREHLENTLGPVDLLSLSEIVPYDLPLTILRVQRGEEQFLFTDWMSSHASSLPDNDEGTFPYAELFIRLPKSWPLSPEALTDPCYYWPIEWLFKIARWTHEMGNGLGECSTFANGDPPHPLAPNTEMTCVMATVTNIKCSLWRRPDGSVVTIYLLYPLYTQERDYEREHGCSKLLDLFRESKVPLYVNPERKNVISGRNV